MKFLKNVLLLFLTTGIFISCGDDDDGDNPVDNLQAPTNVTAVIDISQDDTGTVTITPSAEGANSFEIFFGDVANEEATTLNVGQTATNVYEEGTYTARIIAIGADGQTTEISQEVIVAFTAPTNLLFDVAISSDNPFEVTVTPTAENATMFDVLFGDEEAGEAPITIMAGENATNVYEEEGDFVISVVAKGASAITIEGTETITIEALGLVTIPLDFEDSALAYDIVGFEGADSAIEDNPVSGGINTSSRVLRSTKTEGAQFFAGTVVTLSEAIDFSVNQAISINTYSPKANIPVKVRLENLDNSVGIELDVNTTVANEWETLVYDFGAQTTGVDFVKVVVFFEFVVDLPGDGSTYYFDDVQVVEGGGTTTSGKTTFPVDFESATAGAESQWNVFENEDNPALEIIANPDMSGANTSATVAKFTARVAGQAFAGTETPLAVPFTLDATNSTVKILVWKSVISDVGVKFANAAGGSTGEVKVANTLTDQWEELTFDFSSAIGDPNNTDIEFLVIFPDFDTRTQENVAFFDNITLDAGSGSTGGTVALPVDFEDTTLTFDFSGFEGADSAIEDNPVSGGVNTSSRVMRSIKTEGAQFFAGTFISLDQPIDFSVNQAISINTYSLKADIPVRVRLENADNSVGIELDMNTTVAGEWETLVYNFGSATTGTDFVKVVVFFEFIVDLPGDGSTYYFDDIKVVANEEETANQVKLPLDFEDTSLSFNFVGFEGADSAIEDNPVSGGINTSSRVMRSIKTEGAQFFAGTFVDLDEAIDFSSTQTLTIKTYSPKAGVPIRIALENAAGGVDQIVVDVNTTVAGEWEELSFDFSAVFNASASYNRAVVFFEFIDGLPGDGSTYYFDDIELGN